MLKHVVCFKMDSEESAKQAVEVLKSMQGNVPVLRGMEVGLDVLKSARSYDVYLGVLLDDKAALDAYQKDPYHCDPVKVFMHAHMLSSVAVDFEIE
ncbi:MAG: Dabb family protein [Clostridia bacterium]|nr:Dabb family protein [Clostridia bacterium]